MNDLKNIAWSPFAYEETSVVADEAGEEMVNRLAFMTIKPNVILDIGCGTGVSSALLQKHYPEATVLPWDMTLNMVSHANRKFPSPFSVCADANKLPLQGKSVDLLFANFILPWQADFQLLLREWRRVLRQDGLLMFTALGLDTLREWRPYVDEAHIPRLIDMHDMGDLLLQEGLADPVLDVSYCTTVYRDIHKLAHELHVTGMWYPNSDAEQAAFLKVPAIDKKWCVTYEIIYAHAFAPAAKASDASGETKIPLQHLRESLRNRTK